ncbi:hypothetical protein VNO77_05840 [Canavalia gladiata]|uniref:F-box domain-containing protein n=1 Tax=Canavalia gladiata TaxID=3824 RepID=A0AAN9MZ27_CANGL
MKSATEITAETVQLPQELIIEILLKLPVKSLFRFKCVCKSWLSLICDPHFALSHYDHLSAARTCRLVLLAPSASEFRSMDLDASILDDSASAALNLSFLPSFPQPRYNIKIMGSCRGFLLLECHSNLYMWNPSTHVHKQISLRVNAMFFRFLYGFGYDPSTDDYLVLLGTCDPNSVDWVTRVELYSLRADTWEQIEDTYLSYVNASVDFRLGTLFNGAIHWLAFRHDVSVKLIVAFDLSERSFSEIPLPDDFNHNYYFCDLRVLGGFLSLSVVGIDNEPTEIWVMQEYKVKSSWTKTIVVSTDDIPTQYFFPLCSTKCGDIVGRNGFTGLLKCDDKGQVKEHRSYCDNPLGFQVAVYTESLLSLPSHNSQQASSRR